jgi:hypothetical protein
LQIPRSTSTRFPKYKISKIQVFYGQVRTRTPFKRRKCYSPTSRQARVLVVQASVMAYLQDSPSRFFSYDSLNARKQRCSYRQATYKGNFSSVLNQEFIFLGSRVAVFTSNPSCVKYWLLRPFSTRKPCAKAVLETDYFMQQKRYHKRTTLCT